MRKIYQKIGSQIKILRNKAGLTQEDMAEKTGITPEHFNRIERARQYPSLKTLCKIADVLGIEVSAFLLPEVTDEQIATTNIPLRELVHLLQERPKKEIKLVLDLARRVCDELDTMKRSSQQCKDRKNEV